MKQYPIKFHPIYKEKLWGGNKLQTILNKPTNISNCGESWEISNVEGDISIVANGEYQGQTLTKLLQDHKEKLVGKNTYNKFGNNFPLLIKFLDAQEDLSIQVHPSDKIAQSRNQPFGKTEMWYIVQADNNSKLISGFNKDLDPSIFKNAVFSGELMNHLNQVPAQKDDVFFIPAGRIHTIGKGCLIAEIQQSSDTTYRIYDFDRTDDLGNKRELHINDALDVLDYSALKDAKTKHQQETNKPYTLVRCPYFVTNKLVLNNTKNSEDLSVIDSFVIYMCIHGEGQVIVDKTDFPITLGETVLIPACIQNIDIKTEGKLELLQIHLPK